MAITNSGTDHRLVCNSCSVQTQGRMILMLEWDETTKLGYLSDLAAEEKWLTIRKEGTTRHYCPSCRVSQAGVSGPKV